jgi:hypothetical protein
LELLVESCINSALSPKESSAFKLDSRVPCIVHIST